MTARVGIVAALTAPIVDPVNWTTSKDGRASAVCEFCGRKSRPIAPSSQGDPAFWNLPQGWSTAPHSVGFHHRDGSVGSQYVCPPCNRRRPGMPHPSRQAARARRHGNLVAILSADFREERAL